MEELKFMLTMMAESKSSCMLMVLRPYIMFHGEQVVARLTDIFESLKYLIKEILEEAQIECDGLALGNCIQQ